MTKAAMCLECGQVIGPPRSGDWQWCAAPCLHSAVRWRDPGKGLLEVTSLHGEGSVAVLGLHNGFVEMLSLAALTAEQWRVAHDNVTRAPGYLFDKSKRDCWAVLVRPGESNDVFFMPYGAVWAERRLTTPEATP